MVADADHIGYMKVAIEEARKSVSEDDGRTHPMVGVVVVRDGKQIAAAHRGKSAPGNHAEFCALERDLAGQIVAGSTVYTTLEPCTTRNHPKLPCAEHIVGRKVAKVFVGMLDPNPEITGRGVIELRKAGIAVELFPEELMSEVEDLNRHFARFHRHQSAQRAIDSGFLEANRNRPLDDWYRSINRIYWNHNFYQDAMDIFTHLVEVVGGLSQLVSHKGKYGLKPESFVPKALAWWMTLCGKVGVSSVAGMLWAKFPYVCAYCHRHPHDESECWEKKAARDGPDWEMLRQFGVNNLGRRPARISDWQKMFSDLYPVQQVEEYGPTFARLMEELGELAEALRVFPAEPGYFLSEAADVFAWLMHFQNIVDRNVRKQDRGLALEKAFCMAYPDRCLYCGASACKCPPIVEATIGRIASEVPEKWAHDVFMTADVARSTFHSSAG